MTGYGRATAAVAGGTVTVQVSSVNRRTLDLSIKLPAAWEPLESAIGERIRKAAARGKVHVDVEYTAPAGAAANPWSDEAVSAVLDRLAALADQRGIPFQADAALLWQVAHAQRTGGEHPTSEAVQAALLGAVDEAIAAFVAMRSQEGKTLWADFTARLGALRTQIETVAARAPEVAPAYRALLHRRLREAGLELNLEDERVLREIALFADRCDVSEEVTRFRSHLEQFTGLLGSGEEIGRKADFILQELGREANTIGSKANDLAIAKAVIELKNELERIREQMANVE